MCVCVRRTKPPLAGLPDLHDGLLLHADLHHRGLLLQVRAHPAATGTPKQRLLDLLLSAGRGGDAADVSVAHWLSLPVDV